MAIECKNRGAVGAPDIDAYVGKLQDVGIPSQLGIFVSVGRFTSGALDRARDAGVRTLLLEGLTADGLAEALEAAVQSTVFVVATMGDLVLENDLPNAPDPWQALAMFWDENGRFCGTAQHLLWLHWINGESPTSLGQHTVEMTLPQGWYQEFNGHRVRTVRIAAEIQVVGLVMSLRGSASRLSLSAPTGQVSKMGIRLNFETPSSPQLLQVFTSEELLGEYFRSLERVQITHRIRVPRIVVGSVYWPPSQESLDRYLALIASGEKSPTLVDVEGPNIASAFRVPQANS